MTSMTISINCKTHKLLLNYHIWDCRSDSASHSHGELTVAFKHHWSSRHLLIRSESPRKCSFRSVVGTQRLSMHIFDFTWHRLESLLLLFKLAVKYLNISTCNSSNQAFCHWSHTVQITTNFLDRTQAENFCYQCNL